LNLIIATASRQNGDHQTSRNNCTGSFHFEWTQHSTPRPEQKPFFAFPAASLRFFVFRQSRPGAMPGIGHWRIVLSQILPGAKAFCFFDSAQVNFTEMNVQEIKEAVRHLSLEERAEVAACLHSWNDDEWDEQMKHDLAAGKLDKVLAGVDADIAENKIRGMP
jgi:hypothetical protein